MRDQHRRNQRAAGVELGLAEDRAPGLLGGGRNFDQRRVVDRPDKALADLHATLCSRVPTPGLSLKTHVVPVEDESRHGKVTRSIREVGRTL